MKRVYDYKGFKISVDLKTDWKAGPGVALTAPSGFAAVVTIQTAASAVPIFTPLHLVSDKQIPFATEADALMAGCSAGQRLIDDTVVA